jgi:putative ABC transport system permease protein
VVISDGLWRRRYGGNPAIVGKPIDLDGDTHIVVGIAPASLLVPTGRVLVVDFGPRVDVWKPLAPSPRELEGENWNQLLLLRLAAGHDPGRGQQQLHALLNAPDKAKWFAPDTEFIPRLKPIREVYAGDLRPRLLALLGGSILLLLIACTNIASLVLGRVAQRSTELATRMAIGAGRAALVVQLLTESVVLALAGGAVGVLVAFVGVRALVAYGPDATLFQGASVNAPVLGFALATSVLTGIACGLLPAIRASRKDFGRMLQEGSRGGIGGGRAVRAGQTLVGIETALGTTLLASAVLLLHSFANVMHADRGYDVQQTLAVDVALPVDRYTTGSKRVEFYRAVTEQIAALPGVAAVGAISNAPADASSDTQAIFLDTDIDIKVVVERPSAGVRSVISGYFSASRTPLLAGRYFEPHDPVTAAIVGKSLATSLWPGERLTEVPGRRIRSGGVVERDAPLLTIVGVVEDIHAGAVDRAMLPQLYRPHLPARSRANMTVLVRTSSTTESMAPEIRDVVRRMDATVPVPAVRTMAEIVRTAIAERRFQMLLTGLFAIVALLLGAVGIFGVVSYGVARRTREIGLRLALGAMRRDVVRSVLTTGLRPVGVGVGVGTACAVVLWSALDRMLYGIEPTDPLALGAVSGLLLATGIVACAVPALRAARLDPVVALRSE